MRVVRAVPRMLARRVVVVVVVVLVSVLAMVCMRMSMMVLVMGSMREMAPVAKCRLPVGGLARRRRLPVRRVAVIRHRLFPGRHHVVIRP